MNLTKTLKNSTPGKVVCIWHIDQVQIDPMKFERTQIHFFTDVSPQSSSLLKVPNDDEDDDDADDEHDDDDDDDDDDEDEDDDRFTKVKSRLRWYS